MKLMLNVLKVLKDTQPLTVKEIKHAVKETTGYSIPVRKISIFLELNPDLFLRTLGKWTAVAQIETVYHINLKDKQMNDQKEILCLLQKKDTPLTVNDLSFSYYKAKDLLTAMTSAGLLRYTEVKWQVDKMPAQKKFTSPAVKQIMEQSGKPLSIKEINKILVDVYQIHTNAANIRTALRTNNLFCRVACGVWMRDPSVTLENQVLKYKQYKGKARTKDIVKVLKDADEPLTTQEILSILQGITEERLSSSLDVLARKNILKKINAGWTR